MAARNHMRKKKYNNISLVQNWYEGVEKGMSRYRLAMNCGITHSTLKNIMNETVADSLLSTVILIAYGFGMSVSEFLDSPLFAEDRLDI